MKYKVIEHKYVDKKSKEVVGTTYEIEYVDKHAYVENELFVTPFSIDYDNFGRGSGECTLQTTTKTIPNKELLRKIEGILKKLDKNYFRPSSYAPYLDDIEKGILCFRQNNRTDKQGKLLEFKIGVNEKENDVKILMTIEKWQNGTIFPVKFSKIDLSYTETLVLDNLEEFENFIAELDYKENPTTLVSKQVVDYSKYKTTALIIAFLLLGCLIGLWL